MFIEPESETEQFVAAYVPDIEVPLTIAVTANVQLVGALGTRFMDTAEPLIAPFSVPPSVPLLLLLVCGKVTPHVPERDVLFCAIVACMDPVPARLSEMVPDHAPAIDGADGDVGDEEPRPQPVKSTMVPRRRTERQLTAIGFSSEVGGLRRILSHIAKSAV